MVKTRLLLCRSLLTPAPIEQGQLPSEADPELIDGTFKGPYCAAAPAGPAEIRSPSARAPGDL